MKFHVGGSLKRGLSFLTMSMPHHDIFNIYMVLQCEGSESSTVNKRSSQTTLISSRVHKKRDMDRGMGGALLTEKLDRSNYAYWEYKMHQYLLNQDYWSYMHG